MKPIRSPMRAHRSALRWLQTCLCVALLAVPVMAQSVPSGQSVTLNEVLVDTVGDQSWLRFRFVAPQIARDGGDVSYAQAEADFAHLCETVALPYLDEYALQPDKIVISLMDRMVAFGTSDPEATQFFEAFRPRDGSCLWEEY